MDCLSWVLNKRKYDISNYQKIIPCGIKDKGITTLKKIKSRNYNKLSDVIIKNLVTNLKI